MKFLCICQGGRVRSGAMAWALKDVAQDSLAAGWEATGAETLKMLSAWADAIVFMQAEYVKKLEEKIGVDGFDLRKIIVVDVGPDVFGTPAHEHLLSYLRSVVMDWMDKKWRLVSALGNMLPLDS